MADIKTLNDFFSELKTNGVRLQNQFQLTINTPFGDVNRALESITIFAEGSSLPGRTQEVVDLAFMGYTFKVPTNMKMTQEMTLTIRSDASMIVRNAFLKWQSYISNPDIEGGSNLQGDKRIPANSFVRLRLMDGKFENVVNTYKLHGAIVTSVGDMALSNTTSEVATFDVGLTYQFWSLETNSTGQFTDLV